MDRREYSKMDKVAIWGLAIFILALGLVIGVAVTVVQVIIPAAPDKYLLAIVISLMAIIWIAWPRRRG